jgi:hypothetical protein
MVSSVDAKNRTLTVGKFLSSKRFTTGDSCAFLLVDKSDRDLEGVRPGQKVTLTYQDVNGVLVAARLVQEPLLYKGTIKEFDNAKHTVTVGSKVFKIADGCTVVLRDNRAGTLPDVKPGHLVTVLHEDPEGIATARQIAQTSEIFRGALTAIDLGEHTLKAKAGGSSKQFRVASNCAIILSGKTAALGSLKPGDKLEFSYDEVDGVNVVTRIVQADDSGESPTAESK